MKTAIIYGVIASLIALFFMYLDTVLLDNPKTKLTYFKNMLLVGGIVGGGIKLIGEESFEKLVSIEKIMSEPHQQHGGYQNDYYGGGGGDGRGGMGGESSLSEDVYRGNPNF